MACREPAGELLLHGRGDAQGEQTGYTFTSTSTTDPSFVVTDNNLTFTAPGADPKSNLLFYAVHGGIKFTPGSGVRAPGACMRREGESSTPGVQQ